MTVVPNYLVTGILALVLSLAAAVWATGFVQHRYGGPVLMVLCVLMLLVGAGFIPLFVGLMAGAAGICIHASFARWRASPFGGALRFGARLWPWLLVAHLIWVLVGQWLLERFLPTFLLNAGLVLFFCFDICLPLLAVLAACARDALREEREGVKPLA